MKSFEEIENPGDANEDVELPSKPSQVPLSQIGSLYLLTANLATPIFFGSKPTGLSMSIFPEHASIVQKCIGSAGPEYVGSEPEPILDAVLFTGLLAFHDNGLGRPEDDETFNEYLQAISLISANSPNPILRFQAHTLLSEVLHAHPFPSVRLAFIHDTLEHCPYTNLKTSAVGWLKDEILTATTSTTTNNTADADTHTAKDHTNLFASHEALDSLSPYLFPDLTASLNLPPLPDAYSHFSTNFSLYITTLNFYYLLLISPQLRDRLQIGELHSNCDIAGSFLQPLRQASEKFRNGVDQITEGAPEQEKAVLLADLEILDDCLERVTRGVTGLNKMT